MLFVSQITINIEVALLPNSNKNVCCFASKDNWLYAMLHKIYSVLQVQHSFTNCSTMVTLWFSLWVPLRVALWSPLMDPCASVVLFKTYKP